MNKLINHILIAIIFIACNNAEKVTQKSTKQKITGIFCTEAIPADIGSPYRLYLKFSKNGIVLSKLSSLNCDSISKVIDSQFDEKANYTFLNRKKVQFTFIGKSVNDKNYKATYNGNITKNKLDLNVTVKYTDDKASRPHNRTEKYELCKH